MCRARPFQLRRQDRLGCLGRRGRYECLWEVKETINGEASDGKGKKTQRINLYEYGKGVVQKLAPEIE